jgi:hypothetical protein
MTIRTAKDLREAALIATEAQMVRDMKPSDGVHNAAVQQVYDAISALPVASEWRPIAEAPLDPKLTIEVYAPARDGLNPLVTLCNYHPDAGWCVCELREVTHWRPHVAPEAQP